MTSQLIVLVGPTAVGKTKFAVELAKSLNTEILSADSRQFYKQLNIGTAKPSADEMEGVPHHFIDFLPPDEGLTAGQFEAEALKLLSSLFKKREKVILTGGSGLFIKAVCEGIDELPAIDPSIRASLNANLEKDGLEPLVEQLKSLDPVYAAGTDLKNPRRVIRALEVCMSTGRRLSELQTGSPKTRPFDILKIGLQLDREELYQRINDRVDEMMDNGLLNEVKSLLPYRDRNALKTVGYQELFEYFDEELTLEEAILLIKQNSRRYAKRQLTWFNKDKDIHWLHPNQLQEALSLITSS